VLEFAMEYPDRVDTLTLVEPAADWILEQLGEQTEVLYEVNAFVHELFGREVTEADLATFLEYAGFVTTHVPKPATTPTGSGGSHTGWHCHGRTKPWDHPDRSLDDLERVSCPTLLVKGTVTADWLNRVVDVLGERLAHATVQELQGSHACHIESIGQFLNVLERHVSGTGTGH
jgi:pimeloyl-ACP methyl ester carboxylesterase